VSKFDKKPQGNGNDRKKAWRLRGKIKRGEALTATEAGWLAAYAGEAEVTDPPPPAGAVAEAGTPPAAEEPAPSSPPAAAPPPPPSSSAAPPPRRRMDPPPKVDPPPPSSSSSSSKASDWRDKYRPASGDHGGREQACAYFGDLWIGVLASSAAALRSIGVEPLIDPEMLRGPIVLTLDEILPREVALSPRALAVGGSSAILIQRFIRRDEIAAAETKASHRARADEIRRANANSTPPAPPPPIVDLPVAPAPAPAPSQPEPTPPTAPPVTLGNHVRRLPPADPADIARFLGS
jgi:hypothetical protein